MINPVYKFNYEVHQVQLIIELRGVARIFQQQGQSAEGRV